MKLDTQISATADADEAMAAYRERRDPEYRNR
jgi:hypothetical protein